jgi:hypothetical protein
VVERFLTDLETLESAQAAPNGDGAR